MESKWEKKDGRAKGGRGGGGRTEGDREVLQKEAEKEDEKNFKSKVHLGGVSSQRRSRFERANRSHATFVRSHRSVEILEYVFTLLSRFTGTNAFLVLT